MQVKNVEAEACQLKDMITDYKTALTEQLDNFEYEVGLRELRCQGLQKRLEQELTEKLQTQAIANSHQMKERFQRIKEEPELLPPVFEERALSVTGE